MPRSVVIAALLTLVACVPDGEFSGTAYLCDEEPVCPDGFSCADGVCVSGDGDGGGDGDGDGEIPEGSFQMGCGAEILGCAADAQPARVVELAAFTIDRTEVTEAAYASCVEAAVCAPPDDFGAEARPLAPVRGVSWQDADDYCTWRDARLPTEAEWERAARGSDGRRYPWGDDPAACGRAILAGCADEPVEVATVDGTGPFGTADLVGNVAEWVGDWYQSDYYGRAPALNPSGPDSGGERVLRGGSYVDAPDAVAGWTRQHADPLHREPAVGFRCAD